MQNQKKQQQQAFDKPLQRIFDKYGVGNTIFMELMEHAYEAGKKAAWGETTQIPALLTQNENSKTNLTSRNDFDFTNLTEVWVDSIKPVNEDCTYELTQAQANFLRPFLSSIASDLQSQIWLLRWEAQDCWAKSTPDSEEGKMYFRYLNTHRNEVRKLKKRQKSLDAIIRSLKYGE